jgi:hypothetical protein
MQWRLNILRKTIKKENKLGLNAFSLIKFIFKKLRKFVQQKNNIEKFFE